MEESKDNLQLPTSLSELRKAYGTVRKYVKPAIKKANEMFGNKSDEEREKRLLIKRASLETALTMQPDLESAKQKAMIDPLTRLPNRRWFNSHLEQELARQQRTGRRIYILLFDLDDFKGINTAYGHQGGDEALRLISQLPFRLEEPIAAIQEENPSEDKTTTEEEKPLARWGGEEFIQIIDEDVKLEKIAQIFERYKKSLETSSIKLFEELNKHPVQPGGKQRNLVTMSMGVIAVDPPEKGESIDTESILPRLTKVLHYAKTEGGKNAAFMENTDPQGEKFIRLSQAT